VTVGERKRRRTAATKGGEGKGDGRRDEKVVDRDGTYIAVMITVTTCVGY